MANLQDHLVLKQMLIPAERYPVKAPYAMDPIGITIHETDNNASAYNEIYYMGFNPSNYNGYTSFHLAVDEKEAIQGIPFNRNAFHAGDGANGNGNRATIAIEICRNYRTDDLTNYYLARANAEILTGWLMYQYGWTEANLYRHADWMKKNCPRNINDEGYWAEFKSKASKWKAVFADQPAPTPNPTPAPKKPSKYVKPAGTYSEKGKFTNTIGENIMMRQYVPNVHGAFNGNLANGASVQYQDVYIGNGYVWVGNGTTWIPTGAAANGKRTGKVWGTFGGGSTPKPTPPKPVAPKPAPAKPKGSYSRPSGTYSEKGVFTNTVGTNIMMRQYVPNTKSTFNGNLANGASFNYTDVYVGNGFVWIGNGTTWVPTGEAANGKRKGDAWGKFGSQAAPVNAKPKVGDMVLVKRGAKSYNGTAVTSAWYVTPKKLSELKGNRAVLDLGGWSTAFNINDIYKA